MSVAARRLPVLWASLALALVVVIVWRAPGVSSLLLGAFIVTYVCAPIVDRLARRMPRPLATILALLGVGVVILGMLLMLVPVVVNQWAHLGERLPVVLDYVQGAIPRIEARLGIDIPDTGGALAEKLRAELAAGGSKLATAASRVAGRTFGGVVGVLGTIVNFTLLVPLLSFYLLLKYHDLWPQLRSLVPPRHQARATEIKTEIDAVLGGFVRGQLTVALIVGTIFAIGLTIVGIDGGIVIGLINGFLNMIPVVGLITGITLALLMALLKFAGWAPLVGVAVVYAVESALENTVITPRILGNKTGLPPLAVLLAVLGGGELFGFVGMLLAVPGAAVVKVLLTHLRRNYVESEGYRSTGSGGAAGGATAGGVTASGVTADGGAVRDGAAAMPPPDADSPLAAAPPASGGAPPSI